jgi:putative oxidoreductase
MLIKIFQTKSHPVLNDIGLLLLRLVIGIMMLFNHGLPKLTKLMEAGDISFPDPLGVGILMSLVLAIFSEVICSFFIILGLGTRIFSIPLLITMGVAVFMIHANDALKQKELGIIYLIAYLVLLIFGSGKFSIDKLIAK